MQRFWVHVQVHAMQYLIPLILMVLLSVGGLGAFIGGIPVADIKSGALKSLILFAQAMSKTDPLEQSNELVKLEGRRRKDSMKETHEVQAWNHRFMEEGEDKPNQWMKYRIHLPADKDFTRVSKISKEIHLYFEASMYAILIGLCVFGNTIGSYFMHHVDLEIVSFFKLIGRL